MPIFLFILLLASFGCDSSPTAQGELDSIQNQKSVACFVYHRFGDSRYPSTNVSLDTFRKHLKYLKSENFEVMTLSQAIGYLKDNSGVKKVAVITVDDGYKSFKIGAMPLLKEFGYSATLFINSETVGGNSYLSWPELKALVNEGIEIGNHSHTHAYFVDKDEDNRVAFFKNDVETAQKIIKENLDITPETFAYPYGEFDLSMKKAIKDLGFTAAVAQNSGVINSKADFYSLPRFPMAASFASLEQFKSKVSMKSPLLQNKKPEKHIIIQNPPELILTFSQPDIDVKRLQCFIQGNDCSLKILKKSPLEISVTAKKKLNRRRTLYTITVPSKEGGWYWYSHLYINPDIKE